MQSLNHIDSEHNENRAQAQQMNHTVGLFKYLAPSKLEFFEQRLILLTPPEYLNDPWDFLPKGRIPSDDEIVAACQAVEGEIGRSSVIHVPFQFALRERQERFARIQAGLRSKKGVARQGPNYQREIGRIIGVVSLTELPLSRLMWAHYAQDHKGFVAEFAAGEKAEVDGFAVRMCAIGPATVAAKVKYSAAFQELSKSGENVADLCWGAKHPDWKLEEEWRMVWPLQRSTRRRITCAESGRSVERFCLPFAPNGLRRVIFGMRMQPEVRQRLRSMLDHEDFKNVRKERTDIDPETGELVLKPLNSAE